MVKGEKSIPKYRTWQFRAWQYERLKEENRGKNFQYWNEDHDKMLENGWQLFAFKSDGLFGPIVVTSSMEEAKEQVQMLRDKNNFARIVAGYEQNRQRQKMFSVIFKPKKKKA